MGLGKYLCSRSMKIYYSYASPKYYYKDALIPSFRWVHSYLQASSCSSVPEKPQVKEHGAEKRTRRYLDLIQLEEHFKPPIRKGDIIDLHDLLFTKNRDYLVKFNDDQKVKAAQLAGKVIVLYFVPLDLDSRSVLSLTETYNYLLPDNVFEVVLVAYEKEKEKLSISSDSYTSSAEKFEALFALMPWTAVPFSDITSRERLFSRFGMDRPSWRSVSFVIDSSGMVLQSDSCDLFERYGGLGYPFTDERINFLKSQVDATIEQPSLKALLASPKRDYVISNTRDKVPVDTLEEKVVALYFFEEGITSIWQTEMITMAYNVFGQSKSCFEVVLIYLYDTEGTFDCTSEESFWKTFKTMPWLALPYKDSKCRELQRYFYYPDGPLDAKEAPTLVIVGPRGRFIEPWGALVIDRFKLSVYPFTREKVAELYTEKVRELKLEVLWDQDTIFRKKDGSKVRFSQLVGKNILLFFEGSDFQQKTVDLLLTLEAMYLEKKDTRDEFEVIYITKCKKESRYNELIPFMTWFVSPESELSPVDLSLYLCYCHLEERTCSHRELSSILAFDRDGRVVRKSLAVSFSFDHINFPFYAGNMQMEVYSDLNLFYGWWELDYYHYGLLINSYDINGYLPCV